MVADKAHPARGLGAMNEETQHPPMKSQQEAQWARNPWEAKGAAGSNYEETAANASHKRARD